MGKTIAQLPSSNPLPEDFLMFSETKGKAHKTTMREFRSSMTDELEAKINNLESLFFRKVVVKCPACGQWGAAMCECKHCGHPIDLGEMPKGIQPLPKQKVMSGQTCVRNNSLIGDTGIQGAQGVQGATGYIYAE